MKEIPFHNETFFREKKDNFSLQGCCDFMHYDNAVFGRYNSLLFPAYYFERKGVSFQMLKDFICSYSSRGGTNYNGKIEAIDSKDIKVFKLNACNLSIFLFDEQTKVKLKIQYSTKQTLVLNKPLIEIFNIDKIKEDYYKLELNTPSQYLNINKIRQLLLKQVDELSNEIFISYIKDKDLLDIITKNRIGHSYHPYISLDYDCSENEDKYNVYLTKDILFYEIPIAKKALNNPTIRFLLLNILRTYQSGYDLSLIHIYFNLIKKHPEVNSFTKINYFLFTCQNISLSENLKQDRILHYADINNDFNLLNYYNNGNTFYVPKFSGIDEFNDTGRLLRSQLIDKLIKIDNADPDEDEDSDEDYYEEEYSEGYDDNGNGYYYDSGDVLTFDYKQIKEVNEKLNKNYTKRLLKLLQWI